MSDLVEIVARRILAAEIEASPGVWDAGSDEWTVEALESHGYGAMAREAILAVAGYLEIQRRDVPAHGREFAAALRAEAQTDMHR